MAPQVPLAYLDQVAWQVRERVLEVWWLSMTEVKINLFPPFQNWNHMLRFAQPTPMRDGLWTWPLAHITWLGLCPFSFCIAQLMETHRCTYSWANFSRRKVEWKPGYWVWERWVMLLVFCFYPLPFILSSFLPHRHLHLWLQDRMGGRVTRDLQAPRGTKAEMGFRGQPEKKET